MVNEAVADHNEVVDETAKFNEMVDKRISETLGMSLDGLKRKIGQIDLIQKVIDDGKLAERYHFANPRFYHGKTTET